MWVTSVRMRREDRSSISSYSSRRPRLETVDRVTSSLAPHFAQFLCSCLAAVPSSRPAGAEMRRAQGPSRLAVALALPLAPALPGHALTGPSTARGLSGSVRFIGLDALEGAPFVKNRPGDAGELVGERDRQHVGVQPLKARLRSAFPDSGGRALPSRICTSRSTPRRASTASSRRTTSTAASGFGATCIRAR
jgi:hypothetical protein